MMQQPPIDLRMPATERADTMSGFTATAFLIVVALMVAVAFGIGLSVVHEDHAYHGDRAMTTEYKACWDAELNDAIMTGRVADFDQCKPVMPWYAEHPIGYAAIVGLAVFVIGRLGIFMYRMERSRGY